MSDERVGFGQRAARRIRDSVLRTEAMTFGTGGQRGAPRMWNPGVLEAIVTTAITAASGTTYGTGAAQIKVDDGSGAAIDDPTYSVPVTVMNWYTGSGTVAINTHIFICWRNGGWRLLGADC